MNSNLLLWKEKAPLCLCIPFSLKESSLSPFCIRPACEPTTKYPKFCSYFWSVLWMFAFSVPALIITLPLNLQVKFKPLEKALGQASYWCSRISPTEGSFSSAHRELSSLRCIMQQSSAMNRVQKKKKKMVLRLYIIAGMRKSVNSLGLRPCLVPVLVRTLPLALWGTQSRRTCWGPSHHQKINRRFLCT